MILTQTDFASTSYSSSSSRVPLSQMETTKETHVRTSDGARFTALYDGRVRAVFLDRTIIEIRPTEQVSSVIYTINSIILENFAVCIM